MNQIGYHFVDNVFNESQVIQHLALLHATKPACITILGGAQYNEALGFAKRAKQAFPDTRVIFRHYRDGADDGMHTRLSPQQWWDRIGSLYVGTGLTILSDNESTMMDYTPYSAWQAAVMRLAGAAGVGIAYGRFPSWHPAKGREQQMDAMLIEAGKWGDLMTFSPNVYWSVDNIDAFKHPYYVINYAAKLGVTLNTTIGEFALIRTPQDAYHGWRSCNISGKVAALDTIIKARVHLPGIPVCVYSIGKWPLEADTFSLDTDALDTITANLTPLDAPPIVIPPDPPQEKPPMILPTDPRWKTQVVKPAKNARVNIRLEPNTKPTTEVIALLLPDTPITVSMIPRENLTPDEYKLSQEGALFWHPIKLEAANVGWVRSDVVVFSDVIETPQPPDESEELARRKFTWEQLQMIDSGLRDVFTRLAILNSMYEVVETQTAKSGILSSIAQFVFKFNRR